jgi:hypothetical protein
MNYSFPGGFDSHNMTVKSKQQSVYYGDKKSSTVI